MILDQKSPIISIIFSIPRSIAIKKMIFRFTVFFNMNSAIKLLVLKIEKQLPSFD